MKKILLLLAIVCTAFMTAQSNTNAQKQTSLKERAALKVKEIDKMVNLTNEQEKKLIALYSDKNMMVHKPKSVQELQSKRTALNAKLKAILTPKQFSKLVKDAKLVNKKEETEMPQ